MNPAHIPAVAALVAIALFASTDDSRADQLPYMEQPQWEYKVEHCSDNSGLVTQLNQIGSQGWELVQIADAVGVFKRIKTVHDKATTSGVQIELLEDLNVMVLRGKTEDVKRVAGYMRQIEQRRPKSMISEKDEVQHDKEQQTSKVNGKANSTHLVAKYERMSKKELREELLRLQNELLDAERVFKQIGRKATDAAEAYKSAPDDEKAEALLRMLEADAASRKPMERYRRVRSAFEAAQQAYLHLLIAH